MRRRISVAATPTGDGRGEVELNSVELTTERRENRALSTAEGGSQELQRKVVSGDLCTYFPEETKSSSDHTCNTPASVLTLCLS